MKVFSETNGGVGGLVIQAQTQSEMERLARYVNAKLVCSAFPSGGRYQIRIMPDLKAIMEGLDSPSPYEAMSIDDMVSMAVQKGIPVKRNTLKADLQAILEVADKDIDQAKEMAKKSRPAVATQRKAEFQPLQNGAGAIKTTNETQ